MPLIRNNTDEWIITPAEKSALSALLCWSIHYSREFHVVLDKREGTELQDGNLPFLFDVDCGKIKCLDRFSSCGKCERGNCFKRKIWKQRKSLFSILRKEKKSPLIMVWLWWFQESVSLGIYLLFTNCFFFLLFFFQIGNRTQNLAYSVVKSAELVMGLLTS